MEALMLVGEAELDVATELRSVIECVRNDRILPAIRELQAAADYRPGEGAKVKRSPRKPCTPCRASERDLRPPSQQTAAGITSGRPTAHVGRPPFSPSRRLLLSASAEGALVLGGRRRDET